MLSHSRLPNQWLSQYSDVQVETARGFVRVKRGPVLALWPSAQGLGTLLDGVPSVNRVMSPTSTSSRAAPEGPMPLRSIRLVPVAATRALSSLFAAFLRC